MNLPVLLHDVLGWCAVPFHLQTWCVLWHPKSLILVSSDQTTFCQYFTGSPQVILGSWTTLLIIIFTPLSEILRGAPGHSRFMVKWCSSHFRIMTPKVLTGIFRSIEILPSMFCNNKVAAVLRKLFAFVHHEMFLVWHFGHATSFYRPSVGTEAANINFHWWGAGLLSNYWQISAGVLDFRAFLHLRVFMCSILFPCAIPLYYT